MGVEGEGEGSDDPPAKNSQPLVARGVTEDPQASWTTWGSFVGCSIWDSNSGPLGSASCTLTAQPRDLVSTSYGPQHCPAGLCNAFFRPPPIPVPEPGPVGHPEPDPFPPLPRPFALPLPPSPSARCASHAPSRAGAHGCARPSSPVPYPQESTHPSSADQRITHQRARVFPTTVIHTRQPPRHQSTPEQRDASPHKWLHSCAILLRSRSPTSLALPCAADNLLVPHTLLTCLPMSPQYVPVVPSFCPARVGVQVCTERLMLLPQGEGYSPARGRAQASLCPSQQSSRLTVAHM